MRPEPIEIEINAKDNASPVLDRVVDKVNMFERFIPANERRVSHTWPEAVEIVALMVSVTIIILAIIASLRS